MGREAVPRPARPAGQPVGTAGRMDIPRVRSALLTALGHATAACLRTARACACDVSSLALVCVCLCVCVCVWSRCVCVCVCLCFPVSLSLRLSLSLSLSSPHFLSLERGGVRVDVDLVCSCLHLWQSDALGAPIAECWPLAITGLAVLRRCQKLSPSAKKVKVHPMISHCFQCCCLSVFVRVYGEEENGLWVSMSEQKV
jgi:hypothetical protein